MNIKEKNYYHSAIEISSLIIKKLIENAEDYINKSGQRIKLKKGFIAVPCYFRECQKEAIRTAAYLAGIDIVKLIYEENAAIFFYGIDINLILKDSPMEMRKNDTLNKNKKELFPISKKNYELNGKIIEILDDVGMDTKDIDGIILLGYVGEIPRIKDLLKKIFGESKIIGKNI